ncbi:unnamed protein product, partial [Sphacelaria rigidula]
RRLAQQQQQQQIQQQIQPEDKPPADEAGTKIPCGGSSSDGTGPGQRDNTANSPDPGRIAASSPASASEHSPTTHGRGDVREFSVSAVQQSSLQPTDRSSPGAVAAGSFLSPSAVSSFASTPPGTHDTRAVVDGGGALLSTKAAIESHDLLEGLLLADAAVAATAVAGNRDVAAAGVFAADEGAKRQHDKQKQAQLSPQQQQQDKKKKKKKKKKQQHGNGLGAAASRTTQTTAIPSAFPSPLACSSEDSATATFSSVSPRLAATTTTSTTRSPLRPPPTPPGPSPADVEAERLLKMLVAAETRSSSATAAVTAGNSSVKSRATRRLSPRTTASTVEHRNGFPSGAAANAGASASSAVSPVPFVLDGGGRRGAAGGAKTKMLDSGGGVASGVGGGAGAR